MKKKKYQYRGYLWILPAFVLMGLFCYYPPVYAILLSFTNYGSQHFKIVWFENFGKIFSDRVFWLGMKNIVIIVLFSLITGNAGSLLLAEMFHHFRYEKAANAIRFLFIIPSLVPGVVGMLIWQKIIFTPEPSGIANAILSGLGMEPLGWYFDDLHKGIPLLTLLLTGFPYIGGCNFLIYLAGINNIADSVSEAAKLDGVNTMQGVFYIDLPLLMGQIKYFIIMGIIGGIQGYGVQLLFTMGGPNYATTVPGYYMYDKAFNEGKYGYASAVGMIIFIITLVLTIINMKFINKKEEAEA